MKVVVLTRNPGGIASRFVARFAVEAVGGFASPASSPASSR